MKLKTILFTFLTIAIFVLASSTWLVGSYFIDFAFKRGNEADPKAPPKASAGIITPNLKPPDKPDYKNENWTIEIDKEKRTATAFYADRKTDKWIIMVHGYCRNQKYIWNYAEDYLGHGFNVLTPDLNASGDSEGKYLTMGTKESKDLEAWAQLVASRNKNARIALHGVSMGAATVMLATEKHLPTNVYAVIEDCGYTSTCEMFGRQLEKMFGLPSFPVINMIDVVNKIKLGCYMSDAEPLRAVKKAQIPMLFIHGDQDELVPVSMVEKLYQESNSRLKAKYIAKGVGHASSIDAGKEIYFSHVYEFLKKADAK